MRGRRVFVTGASGLVGSHVAERWTQQGWRVRALVRPRSEVRFLERLGCELVVGDLEDPATYRGAAAECAVAVHAAARLGAGADREALRRVNVEGTRHVVTECLRAGVERLVHISSTAVYGRPGEDVEEISEETSVVARLPASAHYARSKRMAEDVVRRTASGEISWSILRPPVVVGERDRHFTPRVLAAVRRPVVPRIGSGRSTLPLVYAGNLALATWLAGTRPEATRRTYIVAGGGGLDQRDLLDVARDEASIPRTTVVPVPPAVAGIFAGVAETIAEFLPGEMQPPLTRRQLAFFTHGDPYRGERIRDELGWRPEVGTREGWARAVRWHARHVRE